MLIARDFRPGSRIELNEKDPHKALLASEPLKFALPLTSLLQQMRIVLMNEGKGHLDDSAVP